MCWKGRGAAEDGPNAMLIDLLLARMDFVLQMMNYALEKMDIVLVLIALVL